MESRSELSPIDPFTPRVEASSPNEKSATARTSNSTGALLALLLAFSMAMGCDTKPVLYSEEVPEEVEKPSVAAAAVQALQSRGYTIALINETTGTVTTEWSDVTGVIGHIFETRTRKRVMVSVSLDGTNISVQMTKQEKTEEMGWRNDVMSGKDKREVRKILEDILDILGIYQ